MERRSLRNSTARLMAIVATSMLVVAPDASANQSKITKVGAASGAATGVGVAVAKAAPLTGPAAPYVAVAGGAALVAEGVGAVACVVFAIFDPPDPINAGVPVNLSDFFIPYPAVATLFPGIDPATASLGDAYFQTQAEILANWRARNVATDRFEGALLVGNPVFAAERLAEINVFTAGIDQGYTSALTTFPTLISAVDALFPTVLALPVTKAEITQTLIGEASGIFPLEEQAALAPFNVTANEYAVLQSHFAQVVNPAEAVEEFFASIGASGANSIAARDGMIAANAIICEECRSAPSPHTYILFAAGLAGVGGYRWMRRWKPSRLRLNASFPSVSGSGRSLRGGADAGDG